MRKRMKRRSTAVIVGLIVTAFSAPGGCALQAAENRADSAARRILPRIGVDRGIVVLLARDPQEDRPAELAVALARRSELTVYLQLPTDGALQKARKQIDAAGMLGTRVYVEKGPSFQVHLADNLADAVVVATKPAMTSSDRDELLRVVRPLGKLLLGDQQVTKPYPKEADDWTHPYRGPENNPQSRDQIARAPYLTQFLSEPWYVPFPQVTVTSAGRVFKAFGHVGYKRRDWPWVNTLVALNGYNGTLLWKRSLEEGFNIHRNTMVATPEILYLADSKSCKLIDAATGQLQGEITAPDGASGPVWKWMAMEDGILYALVGKEEFRDETLRGNRTAAGWPWRPMTAGYDSPDYAWGFGRTFFAVDPRTKKVLWTHHEEKQIDGRAVAMNSGRIYYYSHPNFLACLDAKTGQTAWRNSDPKLLEAIGPHHRAQTASIGFSTSSYLKCSEKAIYFAGPQRTRLVAASTDGGKMLWQYPHGNFQLVLREEGLYAMGRTGPSKLFDPNSGRILADLTAQRGNCTRATGSIDSIFTRGYRHSGTMRLAVAGNRPLRMALMRPDCHDGVIVGGGLLYWGPWMCDCSLSLVGIICLGPAGDLLEKAFGAEATETDRLESFADPKAAVKPWNVAPGDWPAYRADNLRSGASRTDIPSQIDLAWEDKPPIANDPAAPITAGGLVFTSGADGVVRALEADRGKLRWKGYTAGPITYPPAIEQGRLFVGSGDGWVYAFEAATGRPLWRFRAAPAERKINVYGNLASTWPVGSGVLVDDGVVYAAAGIASYDGTHVYALDTKSGRIRWQNNTSGRLAGDDKLTGVSVQGHLLLHAGILYLAGGNVVSPARYDVNDGRCLNTLDDEWAKAPRGRELFLLDGKVVAFERLLYSPPQYWAGRYFARHLLQANAGEIVIRASEKRIARIVPGSEGEKPKALWQSDALIHPLAMALGNNAVAVAGRTTESFDPAQAEYAIAALSLEDGSLLWKRPLPSMPDSWGLALDSAGRIVVALCDGTVLCFAPKEFAPKEKEASAGGESSRQKSELVRNPNFAAAGEQARPAHWTVWTPVWQEAACALRCTENGLLLHAPGNPYAVGGARQDLQGVEEGRAYAVEVVCQVQKMPFPFRSVYVRWTWIRDGKPLHPAGRFVRGPVDTSGDDQSAEVPKTLTFQDVFVAPLGADGARLSLEVKWPRGGSVCFTRVSVHRSSPPEPRKVKIGTVYLRPRGSTPQKNLELFSAQIDAAGKLGLDILCLGEAITIVGTSKNVRDVAEPIPGPATKRLGRAARNNRLWVVAGLTERDEDRVYNTAVLIDRQGHLAGRYRKVHLPREEWKQGITPGQEYPVFQTDFGTVAIQICYDWFFPEAHTIFGLHGAEIVFAPTWGNTLPDKDGCARGETVFRVRARDNGVYLVPSVYDGSSMIIDPMGRILASNQGREGVFWAEVDLNQRERLRWVGHWHSVGPRHRMPSTYRTLLGDPRETLGDPRETLGDPRETLGDPRETSPPSNPGVGRLTATQAYKPEPKIH